MSPTSKSSATRTRTPTPTPLKRAANSLLSALAIAVTMLTLTSISANASILADSSQASVISQHLTSIEPAFSDDASSNSTVNTEDAAVPPIRGGVSTSGGSIWQAPKEPSFHPNYPLIYTVSGLILVGGVLILMHRQLRDN